MTKAKMIETLQQMETEAWEELLKYEFEKMPPCTADEEMRWTKTNQGYRELINRWIVLNDVLRDCGIETIFNKKAMEYSSGTYRRNKEYREQLKAGA